ncbi:MAG: hypothetical protein JNM22_05515 [Saprospiraceae bacterium]|nr:hypothetical protein [Saprospiraceae bacterium]
MSDTLKRNDSDLTPAGYKSYHIKTEEFEIKGATVIREHNLLVKKTFWEKYWHWIVLAAIIGMDQLFDIL